MNPNINLIYQRLFDLQKKVKQDLKRKGLVPAKKNNDGTISVGRYKIIKNNGFYEIIDWSGEIKFKNINLAQTAAVVANNLAVNSFTNNKFIEIDYKYGSALFEEHYLNKLVNKKNVDKEVKEIYYHKAKIAAYKKAIYRNQIEDGYAKLISIR